MTLFRNVLAIVIGVAVGAIVNMSLVLVGSTVIAAPAGVDVTDSQSLSSSVHLFGPQHFLFPFLAHALGTLAGALVAYLVAATHRAVSAYVLGAFFLAGGIAAATMIPAPAWFIALDLVLAYIPMAWLAIEIGRRISRTAVAVPVKHGE